MVDTDASLYAMRLRRNNLVANYKAQRDESEALNAIRQTERVQNAQNEYGALLEAHRRLPQGLQRPAMERMRDLSDFILNAKARTPLNFPGGSVPDEVPVIPAVASAAAPAAPAAPAAARTARTPRGQVKTTAFPKSKAKPKSKPSQPEDEPTVRNATLERRLRESRPTIEVQL